MSCMRKINGNEVEKFSVIKLISSEEFKEEDRCMLLEGKYPEYDECFGQITKIQ